MKPRIFIGSSVEGLDVAYALQKSLEYNAEVTVWSQGIFTPSSNSLDDLLKTLQSFDFGAFVFSIDDEITIREHNLNSVRDNVLLEFGLFIGVLGKSRVFFIMPRDIEDIRIPSDLVGVNPLTYVAKRSDGNLEAALGPAANDIRSALKKIGKRKLDESKGLLGSGTNIEALFSKANFSGNVSISFKNEQILDATDAITISLRILFYNIDPKEPGFDWQAIIQKNWYEDAYGLMLYTGCIGRSDPSKLLAFYLNGCSVKRVDYEWKDLKANCWYKIVCVYNGKEAKIYIDNELKVIKKVCGNINSNQKEVFIGKIDKNVSLYEYPFNGEIVDLKIVNRALTDEELKHIFS